MASPETGLLSTCAGMFFASLLGGFLPRCISSPALLDKVSILGAGLLVGTALCVILPEGFEYLHHLEESGTELPEWVPSAVLLAGFMAMIVLDFVNHAAFGEHSHDIECVRDSGVGHTCNTLQDSGRMLPDSDSNGTDAEEPFLQPNNSSTSAPGGHHHSMSLPTHTRNSGSSSRRSERHQSGWQVLCGLLVHSAADGLAVGASAMSGSAAVTLTVALAMVAHKAPVAFGLTTFLLGQARWRWEQVVQGLMAFSLAAPLVAVATYASIQAVPTTSTPVSVALAMLFSGGTFVYAACIHVLPGVLHPSKKLSGTQLSVALLGCVLPLVLTATMPHHH